MWAARGNFDDGHGDLPSGLQDQEKRLGENQAETRTWDGRTAPPEALRALDGEDTALKTLRVIQERHTCLEVRESGPETPPNSSLHVEGWVARGGRRIPARLGVCPPHSPLHSVCAPIAGDATILLVA